MFNHIMGYTIKAKIGPDTTIDVSGDDYETVVKLFNQVSGKFSLFGKSNLNAAKAKIKAVKTRRSRL
jgi:hypothetical protein